MLQPKFAIIYYEGEAGSYLEKGEFTKSPQGKADYSLGALRPFSTDELMKLQTVTAASKGIFLDGLIPKEVVYLNQYAANAVVAWIEPAQVRNILFQEEELRGDYEVPNTLFLMHNTSLHVWLVKKKDMKSFSLDTDLYQSHYFNVYEDCNVCIGTGYKPNVDHIGLNRLIKKISENFWTGSYFTHAHVPSMDAVWRKDKGVYPEKKWKKKTTLRKELSKFIRV